jgi:crotonobetainyl-CoA:carnitine CoA-transferase CaiB-like acyl-CoA transferase
MELELPHPQAGKVKLISNPIRFDGEALNSSSAPPLLGEHTEEVLKELLNRG